jgi:hypothetical protein
MYQVHRLLYTSDEHTTEGNGGNSLQDELHASKCLKIEFNAKKYTNWCCAESADPHTATCTSAHAENLSRVHVLHSYGKQVVCTIILQAITSISFGGMFIACIQ